MPVSSTIASEYYKLQEMWEDISSDPKWRLAVWSVKDEDVLMIEKFFEVEQSPLGMSEDIFFRFETPCENDEDAFNNALWEEYIIWFEEELPEKYDMYGAFKKDGLLKSEYKPDKTLERTPINLMKEMLRFKSCLRGFDDVNFCVCLSKVREDVDEMTEWYRSLLEEGVPDGIHLTVIDDVKNRKIKLKASPKVVILTPDLNMREALGVDMNSNCGEYNPVDPASKYDRQLRTTLECAMKKNGPLLTKEVNKLYACSKEMNNRDMEMATPLIASQAYYMISVYDPSLYHAGKAVALSKEAISKDSSDEVAYNIWKASMYQQGAILSGQKKYDKALAVYDELIEETANRRDIIHIMEACRMSGVLYREEGKKEEALQQFLLSLYAGSHLDMETRRESSFLFVANLVLLLSREIRGAEDNEIVEKQLHEWLGDDWRDLVEGHRMKSAKTRRRKSVFG